MAIRDIVQHFRVPRLAQLSPLILAIFGISILINPGVVAEYFSENYPGIYNPLFGGALCLFAAFFLLFVNRSSIALYVCNSLLLFQILCVALYTWETHSAAQSAILQGGYLMAVFIDVYHSTSSTPSTGRFD